MATGTLNGEVGVENRHGELVPPTSAGIHLLFASPTPGDAFLLIHPDLSTAGGQYSNELDDLLAKNKDLKKLEESARRHPQPHEADQIAAYYLATVDEALAKAQSWLEKHPNRAWEVRTLAPDERGRWSFASLPAGEYEIVGRGEISGHDADWEATVYLPQGRSISVPLTRPRFFRLSGR
ncbi:MAG: hypothetical protein ACRD3D_04350 [Terriglobia bacterium]